MLCLTYTFALLSLLSTVPASPTVTNPFDLKSRNASTVEVKPMPEFDLKPPPFGAPCGMTWDLRVKPHSMGKVVGASPICQDFTNYIGAGKDASFIYLCPPKWPSPTTAAGFGSQTTKVQVKGPAMFSGGGFQVTLTIANKAYPQTDLKDIPFWIQYRWDRNNPVKPGFAFFTMTDITCAA